MTKESFSVGLAVTLGLLGACDSGDHVQRTDPGCVDPVESNCRITVDEHSFVRWTGPVTDGVAGGVSTAVVEHAPGRFCMSGKVDPGPNGSGWGALLVVGFDHTNDAGMLTALLDASALGIAKVRFTVEDPPLTGVLPQITQIETADCTQIPDCIESFTATTSIIDPGPVTLALSDFPYADADHPGTTLDPKLVTSLQFYVGPLPGMSLDYAFCIRDLAFLDAAGREITP
jgi:hypothetical protein